MSVGKLRMNTSDLASLMTSDITLYFLPIPGCYSYLAYTQTHIYIHFLRVKTILVRAGWKISGLNPWIK